MKKKRREGSGGRGRNKASQSGASPIITHLPSDQWRARYRHEARCDWPALHTNTRGKHVLIPSGILDSVGIEKKKIVSHGY